MPVVIPTTPPLPLRPDEDASLTTCIELLVKAARLDEANVARVWLESVLEEDMNQADVARVVARCVILIRRARPENSISLCQ